MTNWTHIKSCHPRWGEMYTHHQRPAGRRVEFRNQLLFHRRAPWDAGIKKERRRQWNHWRYYGGNKAEEVSDFLGFLRSLSCNIIPCILSFLLVALGSWLGLSRGLSFLPNFSGCTFSSFVFARLLFFSLKKTTVFTYNHHSSYTSI